MFLVMRLKTSDSNWLQAVDHPRLEIIGLMAVMLCVIVAHTSGKDLAWRFPYWDGQLLHASFQQGIIPISENSELFVP